MEPDAARRELLAQHADLRRRLASAEMLARRLMRGDDVMAELGVVIDQLHDAFAQHNRSEEALIVPLLELDPAIGPRRVARMIEEHAEEHRVMRAFLKRPLAEVAAELTDWAEELAAHMDAEERTFLSVAVLGSRGQR
jgi:iron-sulfur cluster repair protein YtfE (RIC family)